MCRQAKNLYFKNKFNSNVGNMRATWNTLREALGTPKSCKNLPGYFKANGSKIRAPKDIAQGFNDFFSTIGTNLDKDLKIGNYCYKDFLSQSKSRFHFR